MDLNKQIKQEAGRSFDLLSHLLRSVDMYRRITAVHSQYRVISLTFHWLVVLFTFV